MLVDICAVPYAYFSWVYITRAIPLEHRSTGWIKEDGLVQLYIVTILELKVLKQEDEVNTLVLSQLAESRKQNKFGESRLSPLHLPSDNRGFSLLHSPTGYQSDIYQVTL